MDYWKSAAHRQAASRSKFLYTPDTLTTHTHHQSCGATATLPSRSAIRSKGPDPARRVKSTSTHRYAPYSLTPVVSSSNTNFSAATVNKLERAIAHGLATRTQQNYSGFISQFLRFCDLEGLAPDSIFPADELVLCAFIGSFVGEKSGSTAAAAIAALKAWHRLHGMEWKGGYLLSHVLKGASALAPSSSRRPPRPPITREMLQLLRSKLDPTSTFDSAVFAAALTAFWGQCRLGELLGSSRLRHDPSAYPSRSAFSTTAHLTPKFPNSPTPGATLRLPRTKTHPNSGEIVHLTVQRDGLSPIAALEAHFRANPRIPKAHHIFAYTSPDGTTRCLTREDFLARCNAIWASADYPNMTGHSFRIGGTHAFLAAGVPCDVVKKLGRWSSDAYLRYWRGLDSLANLHTRNISSSTPIPATLTHHTRRPKPRS